MHYELWFGEKEKLFWDFFSGDWRLDGTSQIDDERRILRIPTTAEETRHERAHYH